MELAYFYGVLTFLFTLRHYANACSCFPTHTQNHYCRADFVIVATVKNVEEIYNNPFKQTNKIPEGPVYPFPIRRKFKARIHRSFKKNGNDTSRDIIINTPGSDAACGVQLDKNKKYIIGGYKVEGDYWINLCGWVQEYKTLNRQQIKGLKFFYGKNCQCKVSWCNGNFCNSGYGSSNKKTCKWEPRWSNDCYIRYGVCSENRSDGSCSWKKNRKFKTCLQTNDEVFPWKQRKPSNEAEVFSPSVHEHEHSPGYMP